MDLEKEKGAPTDQANAPPQTKHEHTKEGMILAILRAGQSLNRFEAERLGDHCLHSTVATLRSKGYVLHSEWEWVRTRFGQVHVKRYRFLGGA